MISTNEIFHVDMVTMDKANQITKVLTVQPTEGDLKCDSNNYTKLTTECFLILTIWCKLSQILQLFKLLAFFSLI